MQALANPTEEQRIRSVLPDTMVCQIVGTTPHVPLPREFTLRNLRSGTVEASFYDQNSLSQVFSWSVVAFGFSNECDNMYSVFFPGYPLFQLGRGEADTVSGSVHFSQADDYVVHAIIQCRSSLSESPNPGL